MDLLLIPETRGGIVRRMKSKRLPLVLLFLCLPVAHADDARERKDIARELHRIAILTETRPPSGRELADLRDFRSRELTDLRRSLEMIRRSVERQVIAPRGPSVANGGTSARRSPRRSGGLYDPGKLGATKPFGR